MKVGVLLPSFDNDAESSFEIAHKAERIGLDGLFAYHHLWPLGFPDRPAISPFPLLGAISQQTSRIALGTLVARIGLMPDADLHRALCALHQLSKGRFIAGIGTGDEKSAAENEAFGIDVPNADERRMRVSSVARDLIGEGVPVWIGGGSKRTNEMARMPGAVLNLWSVSPERLEQAAKSGPVTWGGSLPSRQPDIAPFVSGLARAGASWAVFTWPGSFDPLEEALASARGHRSTKAPTSDPI